MLAANFYTAMANNAAYSMMLNSAAQMSLLRNCGNISFRALHDADKRLAMQRLNDNLQWQYASCGGCKKPTKRGFDTFA